MGKKIRQFFRDLFGSRLAEHLQLEVLQLRQDFENRLTDKDKAIRDLQERNAYLLGKVAQYELLVLPSRVGVDTTTGKRKPQIPEGMIFQPTKTRWQMVQEEHEKKMQQEIEEEERQKASQEGSNG